MPLTNGQTFAGYTIIRLLGSGGMGEVYLVQHPRLPRHDAIKVLRPDVSSDTSFRERFIREADLAAGLRHPHIVGIHDRGEHDGQLWIAMDYIDGTDAAQLMHRYPAGMPAELAIHIITAVASALDYAHKKGLLHRDIKPANIIVTDLDTDDRRIFLADFGIARSLEDISGIGITTTNTTVGTVAYAAPEQLMGEQLDGRADQYALAATTYVLLTGLQLFPNSNPAVVISQQLNSPPPALGDRRPDCAGLQDVLNRALAKNPDGRFPSCTAFAQALVDEPPGLAASLANAPTQAAPQPRSASATSSAKSPAKSPTIAARHPWAVWAVPATAAVAILLIGVAAPAWRPLDSRQSTPASTTSSPETTTQLTSTNAPQPSPPTATSVTPSTALTTTSLVSVIPSTWTGVTQTPNDDGTTDSLPVTLALDSSDPISGVMNVIGPQHTCTYQLSEAMRSSATKRVVNGYNTAGPCGGDNATWSVELKPDRITGSLLTRPQNTFTLTPG
jgi:serine/threonine protein kinase, bacterial